MDDTLDSNGAKLDDGDSVTLIRDLKIKGMSKTLKRGTAVKSIRLTGKPDQVECRLGKATVVLRTEFLKKA
jgi:protein PhnA